MLSVKKLIHFYRTLKHISKVKDTIKWSNGQISQFFKKNAVLCPICNICCGNIAPYEIRVLPKRHLKVLLITYLLLKLRFSHILGILGLSGNFLLDGKSGFYAN